MFLLIGVLYYGNSNSKAVDCSQLNRLLSVLKLNCKGINRLTYMLWLFSCESFCLSNSKNDCQGKHIVICKSKYHKKIVLVFGRFKLSASVDLLIA